MSWQRIPPELVEEILDHLCQDKRALKMCSLVCKAWLHPAYRRLFYDTRLRWDRLRIVFGPRSKSTAAPFIRRLRIAYSSSREWNETFPLLDGLHSVTSLSLDTLLWDEILPEIRSTVYNRFMTITRLQIRNVRMATFSELAQMICSFRCLEKLIVDAISWQTSDEPASLLRLPRHFYAIELHSIQLMEILGWLCSFGQDLTLRNVGLLSIHEYGCRVVNNFLRILGPSLESCRLGICRVKIPIQLHHNTHLRFLHLDAWRGNEGETGLTPLLSHANSAHIEKISLHIHHCPSYAYTHHDCVPMEWGDVDATLTGRQFSNLKNLHVRHTEFHPRSSDIEYPLEWFCDRLPLCHKRGILRLDETRPPFL